MEGGQGGWDVKGKDMTHICQRWTDEGENREGGVAECEQQEEGLEMYPMN